MTAVVLAPRWRFGRRALAKRAVESAVARWNPRCARVVVACQAVAAPALRETGNLVIVPDSETPLSAVSCALEACGEEILLVLDTHADASAEDLAALRAALDVDAGAVALVDRRVGLRPFPLLCRREARPIIDALVDAGRGSVEELLRRPCGRLVPA